MPYVDQNGLRINIYAPFNTEETKGIDLTDAANREKYNITWAEEPARKDNDFYVVNEIDKSPYIINSPRPRDVCRQLIVDRIKQYRDNLKFQGCLVGTDWFHNDSDSRGQWERMANKSANKVDNEPYMLGGQQVKWKVIGEDREVPLTAGKIREVVDAMELREGMFFAVCKMHIAAVKGIELNEDLTHEEAVEAIASYDYKISWPIIYVG